MEDKLDRLTPKLFLDGPSEFLAKSVALGIMEEKHFAEIFGDSVVDYDKEDFSIRELPGLRVYNFQTTKEHESHYITGDLKLDVVLPPTLRRTQTQDIPSKIAMALLQQFRRPNFFESMRKSVPGLNELGKVFSVNKELVYQNTQQEDECPVIQITLNFRIDQKQWDEYLEEQGRTKDDPFDVTVEDLKSICTVIQGIREHVGEKPKDIQLGVDVNLGENSNDCKSD